MASKKTTTAQNTYEGSSGTPNIGTTISTGTYIYNGEDYSNELAVLRSNLDELTKIKVIQALKKEYNSWWTDPKRWEPTWTCKNETGNSTPDLVYTTCNSGSTTNLNTKSAGNTISNQVYM